MIEISLDSKHWVLWDEHTIENIDTFITDLLNCEMFIGSYSSLFDNSIVIPEYKVIVEYIRELIKLMDIKPLIITIDKAAVT